MCRMRRGAHGVARVNVSPRCGSFFLRTRAGSGGCNGLPIVPALPLLHGLLHGLSSSLLPLPADVCLFVLRCHQFVAHLSYRSSLPFSSYLDQHRLRIVWKETIKHNVGSNTNPGSGSRRSICAALDDGARGLMLGPGWRDTRRQHDIRPLQQAWYHSRRRLFLVLQPRWQARRARPLHDNRTVLERQRAVQGILHR